MTSQEDPRFVQADDDAVRRARHKKGWTQQELAKRAGFAKRTIEHIEGGNSCRPGTLQIVAQALSVTYETLLRDTLGAESNAEADHVIVTLKLKGNSDPEDVLARLRKIAAVAGPMEIVAMRTGSIVLDIKVKRADAEKILRAFRTGRLKALGVELASGLQSASTDVQLRASAQTERKPVHRRGREAEGVSVTRVTPALIESGAASEGFVASGPDIVLDVSDLTLISSSGLAYLTTAHKQAKSLGGRVVLVGARDSVQRVFAAAGADKMFELCESIDDAMNLLGRGRHRGTETSKTRDVRIVPSLLSADFGRLAEDIDSITQAGADALHVDVMDGHFIPTLGFPPVVVAAICRVTELPVQCHLMVDNPVDHVPAFANAGASLIIFHIECGQAPSQVLDLIEAHGANGAIAISPDTDVRRLEPWLGRCAAVLVMTVPLGVAGSSFMPEALDNVRLLKQEIGFRKDVIVEGGISEQTAPSALSAGANVLVVGTAIVGRADRATVLRQIRETA